MWFLCKLINRTVVLFILLILYIPNLYTNVEPMSFELSICVCYFDTVSSLCPINQLNNFITL